MLKIALIFLVVISLLVLLFLLYQSQKMLRQVQKQELAEKRLNQQNKRKILHPKLKQKK
ncbi:hypothetical protein AAC899_04895 [Acinetobacter soli]|uniref:hypothetical protein n=1 Tax=Acinetobacter soli TaxID=487316 RepID=UPI0003A98F72|nr:hypothetical protein [Acinetobacter soli]WEH92399.1 hypothetical protein PYR75_03160 [Acinetobacter soli]WEH98432.1 hypothetical protein PYR76_05275 [Acinetobacter soli]WEI00973.1 hypothetical protein PYR77_02730 [Acinetobacter soli]WEI08914.1 hypothetical protein PYR73_11050 [Acinetobacter soli]